MRHVDEGTIHAWLDGQITDPGEAAWIDEHLRWCAACGARLAEERATLEQAHALLSIAAPAAEPPAFDSLVAKASQANAHAAAAPTARWIHGHRWLIQAGWAASLALAVGIGWMAREMTEREPARSSLEPVVAERAAASTATAPANEAPPPADAGAPGVRASASSEQLAREAEAAARLSQVQRRAAAAKTRAPEPIAVVAPPAIDAQARSAFQESQPNAPAASARQALLPAAAAPAPVSPPPQAEQVSITGATTGMARPTPAGDWRPLPRTEAAARSGMPLYGIDGLLPTSTTISADDRVVRTVYRLDSGDSVVLEQRRASPDAAGALSSVQSARPALTARGRPEGTPPGRSGRPGIAADVAAAAPQEWSIVRGDVRVTLQTVSPAADLNALGARLRVD